MEQVASPADICDLLFGLREESVLAPGSLYGSIPGAQPPPAGGAPQAGAGQPAEAAAPPPVGKISAVCGAVRAAAEAIDPSRCLPSNI